MAVESAKARMPINSAVEACPKIGTELAQCSPQRLPRPALRWALATSLVAAWIQMTGSGPSSSASTHLQAAPSTRVRRGQSDGLHSVAESSLVRTYTSSSKSILKRPNADRRRGRNGGRRFASTSATSVGSDAAPRDAPYLDSRGLQSSKASESRRDKVDPIVSGQDLADLNKAQDINTLMRHPVLLDNIKAPRHPIVLCHGLYGFDVRGPFWGLEIHYWANVLDILRKKIGAEVIVRGVPGTGAIADRAQALHDFLKGPESGLRGKPLNFVGHSMGGLDARFLISVLQPAPEEYIPLSLTTLNAPHRGSPFMDWCNANIGTGNERVESEIREARKKRWPRTSMDDAADVAGAAQRPAAPKQADTPEDFSKHVVEKPPFSLSTPLFVRPSKKDEQEDIGQQEDVKKLVKGTVAIAAAEAASGNGKDENGKEKKRGMTSSLLDFSSFKRVLSSITGSFSSYMLSILDQPAYAMLSTRYMAYVFNPMVPDSPKVAYYSIASRKPSLPVYHPLWLPKQVLDAAAESRSSGGERDGSGDAIGGRLEGNDGLVSVESAKWGKFLGVVDGCDHWDLRGGGAPRWAAKANEQTSKNRELEKGKSEKQAVADSQEEPKESSWIDVNRIIRRLSIKREGKDKEKDEVKQGREDGEATQSTQTIKAEESGSRQGADHENPLVDEVATWISDRLPQRDMERRKETETKSNGGPGAQRSDGATPVPNSSFISANDDSPQGAQQAASSDSQSGNHAYVPPAGELEAMRWRVKLRRDAAWEEELGNDFQARELRRELAWHRAEWDRRSAASPAVPRELDWDAALRKRRQDPSSKDGEAAAAAKRKSADDLERFWIALCRYLWSHGY